GALALTAWWSAGHGPLDLKITKRNRLAFALGAALAIAVTGSITALSDTLFPAVSLGQGLTADFSSSSPWLVRLRIWHPIIAVIASACIVYVAWKGSNRRLGTSVIHLTALQIAVGLLNLTLLAPIWMQLIHLLLADLLWIALVLFA